MRYSFVLGQAFPSESIISKWIIGFAIILNDLILANNYLIDALKKSGNNPSPEGAYFFKLTCSHFREAIKYMKDINDYQEIIDLLSNLEPEILDNYNNLKLIYEPWETSFVKEKIEPIRNKFFHYPNLKKDSEIISRLLEELKNKKTGVYSSGIVKDLRLDFGDEIANAYCLSHLTDSEFAATLKTLAKSIIQMTTFAQGLIGKYLGDLPETIIIQEE